MASGHHPTIPQIALNIAHISIQNLVWFGMTYLYALMIVRSDSMALVVNKRVLFGGCCLADQTSKLSHCCFNFRSGCSIYIW